MRPITTAKLNKVIYPEIENEIRTAWFRDIGETIYYLKQEAADYRDSKIQTAFIDNRILVALNNADYATKLYQKIPIGIGMVNMVLWVRVMKDGAGTDPNVSIRVLINNQEFCVGTETITTILDVSGTGNIMRYAGQFVTIEVQSKRNSG